MSAAKERTRPAKTSSSGRSGNGSIRKKLPFPARLACFWPLAVVPAGGVALWLKQPLPGIVLAFVCNSLLTVLFYREDKRLAEQQNWRIPEFYLHFWELACGWPGALYAQARFHHKWKKLSYMAVFWLYVILNVLGVCWLLCPGTMNAAAAEGLELLRSLFGGRA